TVLLDGWPLTFDVAPRIIAGRTMVPFRAIAEALGVEVLWNDANRSIQAFGPDAFVLMRIDQPTMFVNGRPAELDVPPQIVSSRTLVPLRAFSDAFGAKVDWDEERFTVSITSPVRKMRMLGFYAIRSFPNRHLVPKFSDVSYGWSTLNADGTLNLHAAEYFWPEPAGEITPEVLLQEAAAAGTRRFLLVHDTDADLRTTKIVLDEALTQRAVESIAALVTEKGFDGVNLDLENLGWSERGEELERLQAGYVRFVTAVADRLRPAGKQVIVSVQPLNGWYFGYDYAALAQVADTLHLMAHDYGPEKDQPERTEAVDEGIRTALAAVGAENRSKLMLGVLSNETAETLVQKIGLAKRYNLGGIAFWTIGAMSEAQLGALDGAVTRIK
ncbi:MAG TPA: stalk domain-containing protein, partial [Symbiobacteriaceae bacterium]|nr:stalk domain-containing protein [Symbiobacteriaceae bacterium]